MAPRPSSCAATSKTFLLIWRMTPLLQRRACAATRWRRRAAPSRHRRLRSLAALPGGWFTCGQVVGCGLRFLRLGFLWLVWLWFGLNTGSCSCGRSWYRVVCSFYYGFVGWTQFTFGFWCVPLPVLTFVMDTFGLTAEQRCAHTASRAARACPAPAAPRLYLFSWPGAFDVFMAGR